MKKKINYHFESVKRKFENSGLAQNLAWNFVGRFGSAVINFMITLFLMTILSVEDYGNFIVFFSIYTTVPFFLDLGVNNSFVAIGAKLKLQSEESFRKLVSSFLLIKIISLAIVIFLLSFNIWGVDTGIIIFLGAILGIWESLLAAFKSTQEFKLLSKLVPSKNLVTLLGILFFYYISKSTNWEAYLQIIMVVPLFLSILLYLWKFRTSPIAYNKQVLLNIFNVSKWISLFTIINALYVKTDIFILKYFAHEGSIQDFEIGIFSASFSMLSFMPVLTSTVADAVLPKVSEKLDKTFFKKFLNNIKKTIVPILILLIIGFTVLYFVFVYGFNGKYEKSASIMVFLGIGMVFTFYRNTIETFFYPLQRTDLIFKIILIMFLVNIGLDFFLVPELGALGAAIANLLVIFTGLMITSFYVKKLVWQ